MSMPSKFSTPHTIDVVLINPLSFTLAVGRARVARQVRRGPSRLQYQHGRPSPSLLAVILRRQ